MKKHYIYDIKIPDNITIRKSYVIDKIVNTLNDRRGWKKFGYNFSYKNNAQHADFIITIAPNEKIKKICKFSGLSCADISKNIVYLNLEKWKRGTQKSKLSLDDYRTYLILHECGHIIGKDHIKISDCKPGIKCPIMVQQTLGISNLKPNCWTTKMDNEI